MPVVKKSAKAVAKSPAKVDRLDPDGDTAVRDLEDYGADQIAAVNRQAFNAPRRAVTLTQNVLTVDLTALAALSQGKRQSALKVARNVLDRANQ
jgi:hypothetical protein